MLSMTKENMQKATTLIKKYNEEQMEFLNRLKTNSDKRNNCKNPIEIHNIIADDVEIINHRTEQMSAYNELLEDLGVCIKEEKYYPEKHFLNKLIDEPSLKILLDRIYGVRTEFNKTDEIYRNFKTDAFPTIDEAYNLLSKQFKKASATLKEIVLFFDDENAENS